MIRSSVITLCIIFGGMSLNAIPKLNSQCQNGQCGARSATGQLQRSATISNAVFQPAVQQSFASAPVQTVAQVTQPRQQVLLSASNGQFISANFAQQPVSASVSRSSCGSGGCGSSGCGSSSCGGGGRRGILRRR